MIPSASPAAKQQAANAVSSSARPKPIAWHCQQAMSQLRGLLAEIITELQLPISDFTRPDFIEQAVLNQQWGTRYFFQMSLQLLETLAATVAELGKPMVAFKKKERFQKEVIGQAWEKLDAYDVEHGLPRLFHPEINAAGDIHFVSNPHCQRLAKLMHDFLYTMIQEGVEKSKLPIIGDFINTVFLKRCRHQQMILAERMMRVEITARNQHVTANLATLNPANARDFTEQFLMTAQAMVAIDSSCGLRYCWDDQPANMLGDNGKDYLALAKAFFQARGRVAVAPTDLVPPKACLHLSDQASAVIQQAIQKISVLVAKEASAAEVSSERDQGLNPRSAISWKGACSVLHSHFNFLQASQAEPEHAANQFCQDLAKALSLLFRKLPPALDASTGKALQGLHQDLEYYGSAKVWSERGSVYLYRRVVRLVDLLRSLTPKQFDSKQARAQLTKLKSQNLSAELMVAVTAANILTPLLEQTHAQQQTQGGSKGAPSVGIR